MNVLSYCYHPLGLTEEELDIMASIDRIYTAYPFYGVRKIINELRRQGRRYCNTDQGSQFTSKNFTEKSIGNKIKLSMDSRGSALGNISIERLWRSLKYEDIYLKDYKSIPELRKGFNNYFNFYNFKRSHQALEYKTPAEIYFN